MKGAFSSSHHLSHHQAFGDVQLLTICSACLCVSFQCFGYLNYSVVKTTNGRLPVGVQFLLTTLLFMYLHSWHLQK